MSGSKTEGVLLSLENEDTNNLCVIWFDECGLECLGNLNDLCGRTGWARTVVSLAYKKRWSDAKNKINKINKHEST